MNVYPISADIKSSKNNHKDLLKPNGSWIKKETEIQKTNQLKLFGMGEKRKFKN